jgi:N-methylhydantoinase A
LRIMQSNGGIIGLKDARREGVRGILSGPAGGVVGANFIAVSAWSELASKKEPDSGRNSLKVISFDMGGTSTDVSLIAGEPSLTAESKIGGFPIRIPVLDIHTIGAGGGSIAHIDAGGALRVGPQSAGADPGPACYALHDSQFDLPTVTDANVVLGRLPYDHFLGGQMRLDPDRAYSAISKLGEGLELDAIQTAKGIVDVVNAHMERALRLVSVERGHDPRGILLVSFGGAGGLHACDLAARLGIQKIIVSPLASTLSAYGMSVADVVKDYSRTIMLSGSTTAERILAELQPLLEQGEKDILSEGFSREEIILEASLDMRYAGQSYELNVPINENIVKDFHLIHKLTYGYARHGAEIEVVNIRVRATGKISPPPLPIYSQMGIDPDNAQIDERHVHLSNGSAEIPLYRGESLMTGNQISGPALVVRKDTTIFLDLHDNGVIDKYGNLVIQNSS